MKITDMVNTIASSGLMKKDHYKWSEVSDMCRHETIMIKDINIPDYQRGEASRASTLDKARSHNLAAAGACIVAKRQDGTYWIVDGLQRTLAKALRGDLQTVDCMVFDSKGEKHEAEIFKLCNMGRTNVTAIHKFKVAVIAKDPTESAINEWITANNMVVDNGGYANQIGFIGHLIQLWKIDENSAKKAVLFSRAVGKLDGSIFMGASLLYRQGIKLDDYVQKIIQMGGHTVLLRDINAVAIETGSSKSWRTCAAGLLKTINHRKKYPIRLQD